MEAMIKFTVSFSIAGWVLRCFFFPHFFLSSCQCIGLLLICCLTYRAFEKVRIRYLHAAIERNGSQFPPTSLQHVTAILPKVAACSKPLNDFKIIIKRKTNKQKKENSIKRNALVWTFFFFCSSFPFLLF